MARLEGFSVPRDLALVPHRQKERKARGWFSSQNHPYILCRQHCCSHSVPGWPPTCLPLSPAWSAGAGKSGQRHAPHATRHLAGDAGCPRGSERECDEDVRAGSRAARAPRGVPKPRAGLPVCSLSPQTLVPEQLQTCPVRHLWRVLSVSPHLPSLPSS